MRYMRNNHLPPILKATLIGFFVAYSQCVLADNVDDFIKSIQVATYNCPDDEFMPQVDEYLKQSNVLPEQIIKLKVHKAHWLICVGKNDEAQIMLENLLLDLYSFLLLNYFLDHYPNEKSFQLPY